MTKQPDYQQQIANARTLGESYALQGWTAQEVLTHLGLHNITIVHPLGQFIYKTYLNAKKEEQNHGH